MIYDILKIAILYLASIPLINKQQPSPNGVPLLKLFNSKKREPLKGLWTECLADGRRYKVDQNGEVLKDQGMQCVQDYDNPSLNMENLVSALFDYYTLDYLKNKLLMFFFFYLLVVFGYYGPFIPIFLSYLNFNGETANITTTFIPLVSYIGYALTYMFEGKRMTIFGHEITLKSVQTKPLKDNQLDKFI